MTPEDVRLAVDTAVDDIRRHLDQANIRSNHSLDLIVGIKTSSAVRLLSVGGWLPGIWVDRYQAFGYGYELAHYLLKRLWPTPLGPVQRALIITAHVLNETKEGVQFCGGESDIILLKRGYHTGYLPLLEIDKYEQLMGKVDGILSPLVTAMGDASVASKDWDQLVSAAVEQLHIVRPTQFPTQQLDRFKNVVLKTEPASVSITGPTATLRISGPPTASNAPTFATPSPAPADKELDE